MEQLQLFTGKQESPPQAGIVAEAETPARVQTAGAVGFVYRMPGKSVQWMVEAAVMVHIRRWKHAPAMIRVSPGNVAEALSSLRSLGFEGIHVVPNGGTLACEVETWEAGQ